MFAIVRNSNNHLSVVESYDSIPGGLILRVNEMIVKTSSIKELKLSFEKHNKRTEVRDPAQLKPVPQITKSNWDESKMTIDIIKVLGELLLEERYKDIFKIHNELKLSDVVYCCNRHKSIAKKNIEIWQKKVLTGDDSQ